MLGKKLVTLACAIGILACGACFLPPPPYHPPPGLDLHGVQRIRVEAENVSESHHLDPSDFASMVAIYINYLTSETRVAAASEKEAGVAESVLHVSVLSESMLPYRIEKRALPFKISISATLTKPDGELAWHETGAVYSVTYYGSPDSSADVWKDRNVQSWIASAVGSKLANSIFYGHR
jgi:hypothetical protein